jgi:hypothetical protein
MLLPASLGSAAISPAPVAANAAGAAQSNAATIAAVAGRLNYLEGFDVSGGGATGAGVIEISVTGLAAGTLKYEMNVLAGVTGPVNAQGGLSVRFPTPQPASAPNTAIVVTAPSFGAGNTNAAVNSYGLQQ